MPTPRKQFGRRGLAQQSAAGRAYQQTRYGTPAPAYAAPAYSAAADDIGVSLLTGFGSAFALLFGFRGRIGRREYWAIGIVRFALMIGAAIAYAGSLPTTNGEIDTAFIFRSFLETGSGMFYLTVFIALTVCLFSLEVRRCHDRDASGWWVLTMFIPLVGAFFALYLFLANGFFPGTSGPNRFDTARSQAGVFD